MEANVMISEKTILGKLDIFIRKYYKNRILQGCLLFFALLVAGFLLIVYSEYLFHFGQIIRSLLFFTFILCGILMCTWFLVIPILKLWKIGKVMSHKQAAKIIGDHFSGIGDKLLNTLQLIDQKQNQQENIDLLVASIDQKIATLNKYKFTQIINFRKNAKYLKFTIPPLIILIFIILLSPRIISEPATRIVKFSETFANPLPYQIKILNKKFTALQQEDFELKVKMLGDEIPNDIFIKTGDNTLRMSNEKSRIFTYLFKSLQTNVKFKIIAGKAKTAEYDLLVYPKPTILDFNITLTFPEYINKETQEIENSGDFTVPEGTTATWKIYTKDVEKIEMVFDDQRNILLRGNNNIFVNEKRILESNKYTITPRNAFSDKSNFLTYRVEVIKDGYPTISVTEIHDSTHTALIFFDGIIKDDYGFSKLVFNYEEEKNAINDQPKKKEILIPVDKNKNNQFFYYSIDLSTLLSSAGSRINYYFEVWDNDAINGPKATKSEIRTIATPTIEEVTQHVEINATEIESVMESALNKSKTISSNIEDLKRKLVDQNELNWIEKQRIESQLKNLERISQNIEKVKQQTEENIKNEENILKTNERIIEKQKKLSEMMDQLLTDDLKNMIRELKELLKEADIKKMEEIIEKMKMNTKEIEDQLDKNLKLFKQMEFERKLSKQINDIRNLAEKQEKLALTTEQKENIQEQLIKLQDSIKQQFDTVTKNLKELSKSENELENPVYINKTTQEQEEIQENLNNSRNDLQKKNNRKASQTQKNTAKSMNNLANNLEKMQNESEEEQLDEDANNVRTILENLVRLSFQQESLINKTRSTSRNDPKFLQIIKEQLEIGERIKVSKDSLNAIARRQIYIRQIIIKELGKITQNINSAVELLNNRSLTEALSKEQFIMTSVNNLALLLNEALDQMNQAMNSMSGKDQTACKRPSKRGGKASIKGMREMQEQLGKELEKMKNSLEKMRSKGQGGKQEQGQINKELAKMAAQQEAIRNELQKYKESLMESGNMKGLNDGENLNKTIEEMEENEREILNKKVFTESITRQKRILTRMLESEKAEQQREREEKRESIETKNQNYSNPNTDLQYKIKKRQAAEIIKLEPLPINHFYKAKINSYILTIDR